MLILHEALKSQSWCPLTTEPLKNGAFSIPRPTLLVVLSTLVILFGCTTSGVNASDPLLHVSHIDDLDEIVAAARPGTTILVEAGTYTLSRKIVLSVIGTRDKPVTIRAAQGNVTLEGRGGFDIEKSDWLVIDGFTFGWQARTFNVRESTNVRLTNMTWRYAAPPGTAPDSALSVHWLRIHSGHGHHLDNSTFGPHFGGLGVTVLIENDVADVRISKNYFHDRPRDGRNGAETIRVGSGGGSRIAATIDNNMFERCDGEAELLSVKADGVRIINNTFRDNRGQVVVRNGVDVIISRNQFFGGERQRGGGIRIHGSHICIAQNLFHELPNAALQTFPGHFDRRSAGAWNKGYPSTNDVVVAGNVFVKPNVLADDARPWYALDLGSAGSSDIPADGWTIVNNYFVTDNSLLKGTAHENFIWERNVQLPDTFPSVLKQLEAESRIADATKGQPHKPGSPLVEDNILIPNCSNPKSIMPVDIPLR